MLKFCDFIQKLTYKIKFVKAKTVKYLYALKLVLAVLTEYVQFVDWSKSCILQSSDEQHKSDWTVIEPIDGHVHVVEQTYS